MHGAYLVINNLFRLAKKKLGYDPENSGWLWSQFSWALTFICVVFAWVLFRANTFSIALVMFKSMLGFNGLIPAESSYFSTLTEIVISRVIIGQKDCLRVVIFLLIARFLPNTQQLMRMFEPGLGGYVDEVPRLWSRLKWRPSLVWAMVMVLVMVLAVLSISRTNEFIYFQF